jgi:hypothetical protein
MIKENFLVGIDSPCRLNRNNSRVLSLMSARQVNSGTVACDQTSFDGSRLIASFLNELPQKQNK